MKLLLADDHANTRQIIRRVLTTDLRADIHEVESGLGVLEALNEGAFDLLILDIEMAPLGGIETLEVIRGTASHHAMPVIMVSGLATEETVKRTKALGVVGFIGKPLSPRVLRQRLVPLIKKCLPDAIPGAESGGPQDSLAPAFALRRSSRVWLVGGTPDSWGDAYTALTTTCQLTHWPAPIKAAKQAAMTRPDIIFVSTAASDFLTPGLFARAIRSGGKGVYMILCGAIAEVDGKDRELFDVALDFSGPPTAGQLLKALDRHVTEATLSPVLLKATSTALTAEPETASRPATEPGVS